MEMLALLERGSIERKVKTEFVAAKLGLCPAYLGIEELYGVSEASDRQCGVRLTVSSLSPGRLEQTDD